MKELTNFMMVFRFELNNEYQASKEQEEAQGQKWAAFIGNLAIKEKLVSTNQLGFNAKQLQADLSVTEGPSVLNGMAVGGNMIVRASSIDEAVEMAKDCPILEMGGSVEVRDIIPM